MQMAVGYLIGGVFGLTSIIHVLHVVNMLLRYQECWGLLALEVILHGVVGILLQSLSILLVHILGIYVWVLPCLAH